MKIIDYSASDSVSLLESLSDSVSLVSSIADSLFSKSSLIEFSILIFSC